VGGCLGGTTGRGGDRGKGRALAGRVEACVPQPSCTATAPPVLPHAAVPYRKLVCAEASPSDCLVSSAAVRTHAHCHGGHAAASSSNAPHHSLPRPLPLPRPQVIWSVLLDRPFSFAFFAALHDVGLYDVEDIADFDALGMEKELLAMHRITPKEAEVETGGGEADAGGGGNS
jgi:hypothetical protein